MANKYINKFDTLADYQSYIISSEAESPNVAYIDEDDSKKYTTVVPNNYIMFGTTEDTADFMIGSSDTSTTEADCIQVHVAVEDDSGVNRMYVAAEDVLKNPKYFYARYGGFSGSGKNKILSIDKWTGIDTSSLVSTESMFYYDTELKKIDFSDFDSSSVTDMTSMFRGCTSLTDLDISGLDVSKVTTMEYMFHNCSSLTSLDLSSWNIPSVSNASNMFGMCSSLTTLTLPEFTTSLTNTFEMFSGCSSLTYLNLNNLSTSYVTEMGLMFSGCSSLTILQNLHISTRCTGMSGMFQNCSSLTSILLNSGVNVNTTNVKYLNYLFAGCSSLQDLNLSYNFTDSSAIYMNNMFQDCSSLTSFSHSYFYGNSVTDTSYMFSGCSSMTSISLPNFYTCLVTDMSYMFAGCSSLTYLNVPRLDTSVVENMENIFQGCSKVEELYIGSEFFMSSTITVYDFSELTSWSEMGSLNNLKNIVSVLDGTGRTLRLSAASYDQLEVFDWGDGTAGLDPITAAGWTIERV